MSMHSREFWTEFIELYRNHPCLWKHKDRSYHNKSVKDLAYNELIKKCQTANPKADKDFVQRRIRTLRTVFRKEHKKVLLTKYGDSPVYSPQLWYYKLLLFTADQEDIAPNEEQTNSDDEDEKEEAQEQQIIIADESVIKSENDDSLSTNSEFVSNAGSLFINSLFNSVESSSNNVESSSNNIRSNNALPNSTSTSRNLPSKTNSIAKKRTVEEVCDDEPEACSSTSKTMRSADRDEFVVYGEYVANELRKIQDNHAIAVMQHLINNVLFEGRMGNYKQT